MRETASWRTSCIHDFIRLQLDWTVTEVWLPICSICLYVLYLALTASLLKRAMAQRQSGTLSLREGVSGRSDKHKLYVDKYKLHVEMLRANGLHC